jgi:hypothetical protein
MLGVSARVAASGFRTIGVSGPVIRTPGCPVPTATVAVPLAIFVLRVGLMPAK